jgi:hypothetical protein
MQRPDNTMAFVLSGLCIIMAIVLSGLCIIWPLYYLAFALSGLCIFWPLYLTDIILCLDCPGNNIEFV